MITNLRVSMKGVNMRRDELKDLRRRIEGRIDRVKDDLVTFEREKEVGKFFSLTLLFSSIGLRIFFTLSFRTT